MSISREQVHLICKGAPEIIATFTALLKVIDQQAKRIVELEQRVKELEGVEQFDRIRSIVSTPKNRSYLSSHLFPPRLMDVFNSNRS